MTSTAPGAHPLPEEVDALLDPSGGDAHVEAHVAGCAHCERVREGLREVRRLLGRQGQQVPPEPPDLGARIAAALAAEPPLQADPATAATAGAPAAPDVATVTPLLQRRRRPVTTWLAVAASVAVVGLGGTFLVQRAVTSTSSEAATAVESAEQESSAGGSSGASADDDADEQQGLSGALTPTGAASASDDLLASGADLRSGTDYSRAALVAQAEQLLRVAQGREPQNPPEEDLSGGAERQASERVLADPRALDACLVAVGRPGARPVATDLARFDGEPAAVLVLPDGRGHEVLVVPDSCGSGDDRVLATASLD